MRSGMVTGPLLAIVVIGLGILYHEHMQGNFHKLKAKMETEHQDAPVLRPGGQEAITLTRTRLVGDSMPEFLSATMLPGRGMNVLQITAYIPGEGEISLLASPSAEDATKAMTGTGEDANGKASLAMGGAFEVPWADGIWSTTSTPGKRETLVWRGQAIQLPVAEGTAVAKGGLMLALPSDSADSVVLPDGGNAQAIFHTGDFGGRWPSKTDVTVTMLLSSRSIDFTVTARNVGGEPEPIGIGWHPRFVIPNGNRDRERLRIPGEKRVEVRDHTKGQPTGVLLPVAGTQYDFTARGGTPLGRMDLDDCFVALHQNLLEPGPVAELSNTGSSYGLRLIALSPTIKAMHVVAPANSDYLSVEPQYNYDDPFGREWGKDTDTGMVVLQPGQSTEWKVRLELYTVQPGGSTM